MIQWSKNSHPRPKGRRHGGDLMSGTGSKDRILQRLKKLKNLKKTPFMVVGVLLLLSFAVFLLWFGNANSSQSVPATPIQIYFEGEYSIDGGPWHPIVPGEHIPSTEGDVTLRGNFHSLTPGGEYIGIYTGKTAVAFYLDHIALTFRESGQGDYVADHENPLFGESACGIDWLAHNFTSGSTDPIEILVHNPHAFGNEKAIDEMLSRISLWYGIDFEKEVLGEGETQRSIGILLMTASLVFFGTALFSTLIHVKNSNVIWLVGLVVLFAGTYVTYSAFGVSFWSESIVTNTILLGLSMMLYMLFLSMLIVCFLRETKVIGGVTVSLLALACAVFFLLPTLTEVYFYDLWLPWIIVQGVAVLSLGFCLLREFFTSREKGRWLYIAALLPLGAFCIDVLGTRFVLWKGGAGSIYVFGGLFAVAAIMILKLIPHNINAAAKAKELEMEKIVLNAQLSDSRISTMMSQIRPHFIYNTLGSIEQLCKLDPPKAGELVHNFSKYLRGNFGELDNPKPILMSQEMEHVHHYTSIENVRFPDMTFTFKMDSDDFAIPALTVQPIVENAIKHGLMRLPSGGTIRVRSYESDTHYFVSVTDDGVGFDTSELLDERKHVGLRNIRERLKVMVNGTLEIESTPGVGTKVVISIPKEGSK